MIFRKKKKNNRRLNEQIDDLVMRAEEIGEQTRRIQAEGLNSENVQTLYDLADEIKGIEKEILILKIRANHPMT